MRSSRRIALFESPLPRRGGARSAPLPRAARRAGPHAARPMRRRSLASAPDGQQRARVRPPARADRPAAAPNAGTSRGFWSTTDPRVRCETALFRDLPLELAGGDARGRQRHARDRGADPDRLAARRGAAARAARAATSGRRSLDRPAGCGRAGARGGRAARAPGRGPLARSAARRAGGRGAAAAVHHRAARPTPSATRRSTRASAGSAAAPTAGLHFTPELWRGSTSSASRCTWASTRSGRCRPSASRSTAIHGERYEVEPAAWERIRARRPVLAVGTTTVRVLETLARGGPLAGPHRALRHAGVPVPPRRRLLTNFHLPRSTLLAL